MKYSILNSAAVAAVLLLSAILVLPGCSGNDDCPTCPPDVSGGASLDVGLMHPQPAPFFFTSVWAAGTDDVFVTTNSETVLRRNGSVWTVYDTGGPAVLNDIWGSSSADVFAVGSAGVIRHFDGAGWTTMPSGSFHGLDAVWGATPDTVYAAGYSGGIYRYDGAAWAPVNTDPAPQTASFADIAGSSPDDVWFVGANWSSPQPGFALHWNGRAWEYAHLPNELTAIGYCGGTTSVTADTEGRVWWCTYPVLSQDPAISLGDRVESVWGSSTRDVWVGGHNYDAINNWTTGFLTHHDGSTWTDVTGPVVDEAIIGVGGVSATEAYAVGAGNTLIEWDGAAWAPMNDLRVTGANLLAICGFESGDLWAFGERGEIVQYSAASDAWQDVQPVGREAIFAAWASGPENVYAVGDFGTILHFDGTNWSRINHGLTSVLLQTIWGTGPNDIVVGAGFGQVLAYDGTNWQLHDAWDSTYGPARELWGSAPDDWYAIHHQGAMHYDGTSWAKVELGGVLVADVHGVSTGEVYFLGVWSGDIAASAAGDGAETGAPAQQLPTGNNLIRYNGSDYTTIARNMGAGMHALWAAGSNDIYMVGVRGFESVLGHFNGSGVTIKSAGVSTDLRELFCAGGAAYAAGGMGTVVSATAR